MPPRFFVQDSDAEDDEEVQIHANGEVASGGNNNMHGTGRARPRTIHTETILYKKPYTESTEGPTLHERRNLEHKVFIQQLPMDQSSPFDGQSQLQLQIFRAQALSELLSGSSGNESSIAASLTSQALRHELTAAHAALLVDSSTTRMSALSANPSLTTPQISSTNLSHPHGSLNAQKPQIAVGLVGPAIDSLLEDDRASMGPHEGSNGTKEDVLAPLHILQSTSGMSRRECLPLGILSNSHLDPITTTPATDGKASKKRRSAIEEGKGKHKNIKEAPEKYTEGDIWAFKDLSQDIRTVPSVVSRGKRSKTTVDAITPKSATKKKKSGSDDETWDYEQADSPHGEKQKITSTRKASASKRSKTTLSPSAVLHDLLTGKPIILPDDEDDEDYAPKKSARRGKKAATTVTLSGSRKRTRSNTDDWELMPALPKGRTATVLKQFEAAFEFDRPEIGHWGEPSGKSKKKGNVDNIQNESHSVAASPFKIDLAQESLILPEDEKRQYYTFSPIPNAEDGTSRPTSPHTVPIKGLPPVLPADNGAPIHPIATGTGENMSSTIPDEDYFQMVKAVSRERDMVDATPIIEDKIPVESLDDSKKSKALGRRSMTLAQAIEMNGLEENSEPGIVGMIMAEKGILNPEKSQKMKANKKGNSAMALGGKANSSATPEIIERQQINRSVADADDIPMLGKKARRVRIVDNSEDDGFLSDLGRISPSSPAKANTMPTQKLKRGVTMQGSRRERKKRLVTNLLEDHLHEEITPAHKSEIIEILSQPPIETPENHHTIMPTVREKLPKKPQAKGRGFSAKATVDTSSEKEHGDISTVTLDIREDLADAETSDYKTKTFLLPRQKQGKKAVVKATVAEDEGAKPKGRKQRKVGKVGKENDEVQSLKSKEIVDSESDDDFCKTDVEELHGGSEKDINEMERTVTTTTTPPAANKTESKPPSTPPPKPPVKKVHSPINAIKPPGVKFRVGLSRRANIESLHSYLRK